MIGVSYRSKPSDPLWNNILLQGHIWKMWQLRQLRRWGPVLTMCTDNRVAKIQVAGKQIWTAIHHHLHKRWKEKLLGPMATKQNCEASENQSGQFYCFQSYQCTPIFFLKKNHDNFHQLGAPNTVTVYSAKILFSRSNGQSVLLGVVK